MMLVISELFLFILLLLFLLLFFFLLIRRPPSSTRTYTLFPYTTLFRSACKGLANCGYIVIGVYNKDRAMATAPLRELHIDPLDGWSLPAWTYSDPDFHAAEMERIFRPSWQIVCHDSDIPNVGDWHSIDTCGESVIVVRGTDRNVRAFTNVCRHRGSRLVDGAAGCAKKLVCPYHAWTYELDGRLTGVPDSASYPTLDKAKAGLVPVDLEHWRGFWFVRLDDDGGPSVASMMAPSEAMVEPYRFEELGALGRVTLRPREVNWKNVGDNYSDGLHIPVAHPGLTRLFGKSYGVEAEANVDRMWGDLIDRPSVNWSERMYQRLLPPVPHLPQANQRHWLYFKLWPNVAFDIYPDQVDFMRSEEHTSELQSLMRISYAVFCLKKKNKKQQ